MTDPPRITVELPERVVEQIAQRAAQIAAHHLIEPQGGQLDGYLRAADAARYLGVSRQRIYQLTSARVLLPDGYDGRTPLFTRQTLDAHVRRPQRTRR